MKEKLLIKRFVIKKLFGVYDVDIPFKSNINIFIGENGLGKTTILNTLNYVLQGDSESLLSINFEKIIVVLGDNSKIEIIHSDLKSSVNVYKEKYIRYVSWNDEYDFLSRRIALELLKEEKKTDLESDQLKDKILKRIKTKSDISFSSLEDVYDSVIKDEKFREQFSDSWELKIYNYIKKFGNLIYLPTYRRIEEDFNSYIENSFDDKYYRKDRKRKNFSYLQFGMDDVQELINKSCNTLKSNTNEGFKGMTSNLLTSYIDINEEKQILKNDYNKIDMNNLEIVFSRLADKIDSNVKQKIFDMISNEKYIDDKYHKYLFSIINELINIYEKNKQIDDNLENFKDVCNRYLVNKSIIYDKIKIECEVEQNNTSIPISLRDLSSGEKQIISLFSKLYLNSDDSNIILFDEPELSLSILWQKKLIPDILNSQRCNFIAVITHSPFIFDNEYVESAIDLKKFIIEI